MEIGLTGHLARVTIVDPQQIVVEPKSGRELAQTLHLVEQVHNAQEVTQRLNHVPVLKVRIITWIYLFTMD